MDKDLEFAAHALHACDALARSLEHLVESVPGARGLRPMHRQARFHIDRMREIVTAQLGPQEPDLSGRESPPDAA